MFQSARQWFKSHQRVLVTSAALVLLVLALRPVLSAGFSGEANFGFTNFGGATNLGTNIPIVQTVAKVINIILGFLGVIAIAIIVYAGYIWMTSRGNEEQIARAKRMMGAGVIGLAIIFAAYGIAAFIFSLLSSATGTTSGGGGPGGGCTGPGCLPGGGNIGFTVQAVDPSDNASNVMLCANVQALFNQNVDPASVNSSTVVVKNTTTNATVTFTNFGSATVGPGFSLQHPDFNKNTTYQATIVSGSSGVTNIPTPPATAAVLSSDKVWSFTTGSQTSTSAPTVTSQWPTGANACLRTAIQATFSAEMNITTLTPANIKLFDAAGNPVALGQIVPGSNFNSFTVYPQAPLQQNQTYTVKLSSGITDACNNALAATSWTFTTGDTEYCTPEISNITPASGYYGNRITITGQNFASTGEGVFNGLDADSNSLSGNPNVLCWNGKTLDGVTACSGQLNSLNPTPEQIKVNIPAGVPLSRYFVPPNTQVLVQVGANYSNPGYVDTLSPYLRGLGPGNGGPGQFVTLDGALFGTHTGLAKVKLINSGGPTDAEFPCATSWGSSQIVIRIPTTLPQGSYKVQVVDASGNKSNTQTFIVDNSPVGPGLCSIGPVMCKAMSGSTPNMTLTGVRFGNTSPVPNSVVVGSRTLSPSGPWSDVSISGFVIDSSFGNGAYPISVQLPNLPASNPLYFNVPCQPAPSVVQDLACSTNLQSPSPPAYDPANPATACTNALIMARFDRAMDQSTISSSSVHVLQCGPGSNQTTCNAPTTNVAGTFSFPANSGFTFTPASLASSQWFQVTIDGTVKSAPPASEPMGFPYTWHFQTGGGVCNLSSVQLSPGSTQPAYIRTPTDTVDYQAFPQANNCNALNPASYSWSWTKSGTNNSYAVINPAPTAPADTSKKQVAANTFPDPSPPITIKAAAAGFSDTNSLYLSDTACSSTPDCTQAGLCTGSVCSLGTCTPVIKSIGPTTGAIGTWVGIDGCYFGNSQGTVLYTHSGTPPVPGTWPNPALCSAPTWTNTHILSEVPDTSTASTADDATNGPLWVKRTDGVQSNASALYTVNSAIQPPGLCSATPSSVYQSDLTDPTKALVTLKGNQFGAAVGQVKYYNGSISPANQTAAVTPLAGSWADKQITATTPSSISVPTSLVTVVNSSNLESNTAPYSVQPGTPPGPVTLPKITGMTPVDGNATGDAATVVTITGQDFGGGGQVKFGGVVAPIADCGHWTDTEIVVVVPDGLTGTKTVEVVNGAGSSAANAASLHPTFTVTSTIRPGICSIAPTAGPANTTVVITGRHFTDNHTDVISNSFASLVCGGSSTPCVPSASLNENPSDGSVPPYVTYPNKFKLMGAGQVVNWSDKQITITTPNIPASVRTGPLRVTVNYGTIGSPDLQTSNGVTFSGEPFITSLTPSTGPAGTWVTVRGGNFGTCASLGSTSGAPCTVSFAGTLSAPLPLYCGHWTDTEIVVKAPAGSGDALVTVTTAAGLTTDVTHSQTFHYDSNLPLIPGLCKLTFAPPNNLSGPITNLPTTVTLYGDAFSSVPPDVSHKVVLANIDPAPVGTWSSTQVTVNANPTTRSGDVTLQRVATVQVGLKCSGIQLGSTCIGSWVPNYQTVPLVSNPLYLNVNTVGLVLPPAPLNFVSSVPAAGAANVCRNVELQLTFDQPLSAASVTATTVRLDMVNQPPPLTSLPIPVSVRVSASSPNVVLVSPNSPLLPLQNFTLTMVGGVSGLKTTSGGTMPSDAQLSFGTGSNICKLDHVSIMPASYTFSTAGQSQTFTASALAPDGSLLSGVTYTWSKNDPANVVGYTSSANQATVSAAARNGQATLKVTGDAGPTIGSARAEASLEVYLCELPWEFKDDDYHFRLRYCRAGTVAATGGNFVTSNDSFSSGLTGWTVQGGAGWQPAVTPSPPGPSTAGDTMSAAATHVATQADVANGQYTLTRQITGLTQHTSYVASALVYLPANSPIVGATMVMTSDTSCRTDFRYASTLSAPAVGWQKLQVAFDSGPRKDYTICLYANASAQPATLNPIYFDSVVLQATSGNVLPSLSVVGGGSGTGDVSREYFLTNDVNSDVLGLRIYRNQLLTLSPRQWYLSRPDIVKGSLSDTTVDGYAAGQDGSTLYVSATNFCHLSSGPGCRTGQPHTVGQPDDNFETDLYVFGYSLGAGPTTTALYQELASSWTFNTNVSTSKDEIQRDLRRLTDMSVVQARLDGYTAQHTNTVPQLTAGSFLAGRSVSRWSSWQQNLASDLGGSLPIDPVNTFNLPAPPAGPQCSASAGFDQSTCWNQSTKAFECPDGSHVYQYKAISSTNATLSFNAEFKNVTWWKGSGDAITIPPGDACESVVRTINYQYTNLSISTPSTFGVVASSEASPKISCGSTCLAQYTPGSRVTLTATPQPGSRFLSWGGACASAASSATCPLTLSGSTVSVSATFAQISYSLNVKVVGAGTVTANGSPCTSSSPCTQSYVSGSSVTLHMSSTGGQVFSGWSSSLCSGLGDCTFTMPAANQQVTASFVPQYALNVTATIAAGASATVTSSPAGISCGTAISPCSASFSSGTQVTLTANPGTGSVFSGWTGACTGSSSSCTVTVTAITNVAATFARPSYALTVQKGGVGSGTVTSDAAHPGITCGSSCAASYSGGTSVTLTARANTDSTFTGWSSPDPGFSCPGVGTCPVTMDQARSVTASFTAVTYTLTVNKVLNNGSQGTVTSNESTPKINCGSACTTATTTYIRGTTVVLGHYPKDSDISLYYFVGWVASPASAADCGGTGTCTVNITSNTTITATFALRSSLSVSTAMYGACDPVTGKCGAGTVTSNLPDTNPISCGVGGSHCDQAYEKSPTDIVKLTATPDADSLFVGWTVAGSPACSGTDPCSVTMNTADALGPPFVAGVRVTATFALKATLTVRKSGTGGGTVTGNQPTVLGNPYGEAINCGTSCTEAYPKSGSVVVTLTAAEDVDSVFTGWSLSACQPTPSTPPPHTCNVTMDSDTTVTATFALTHKVTVEKLVGTVDTTNHNVTSTPGGKSCPSGTNNCLWRFVAGSSVTLSPSAETVAGVSYVFDSWADPTCAAAGSQSCTFTASSDVVVQAKFKVAPSHALKVTKSGLGATSGHVASDPSHPGINCDPDCNAQYQDGTTLTLTATTTGVGSFAGWTGCTSSVGTQCTVTMGTTDATVTATFTAYQLTVQKTLNGGADGTVSSTDTKIDCGATCSATYNPGTVTLNAVASKGGFVSWSSTDPGFSCPSNGQCQVTLDASHTTNATLTVTATFTAVTLTLNRSSASTGTGTIDVNPPNANCSAAACTYTYPPGTSVSLTANPDPGSTFAGFSGGGCSTSPCTTTISGATTVTATFTSTPLYSLTVFLQGSGAATSTVTVNPSPGPYPAGSAVVLTANPGSGVTFAGFSGGGCSTSPCTITMNSNTTVTATFVQPAPPSVTTSPASSITTSGARLNGQGNPNGLATTAWFRWGAANVACTSLPNVTSPSANLGSGASSLPFSFTLNGLNSSATYRYCAVAQNSQGLSFGSVVSFTTAAVIPPGN